MKKCIIWGAGFYGKSAFHKLSLTHNVLYYVDNNSKLWGSIINGIEIISPEKMYDIYDDETDIIICCNSYIEIYKQIADKGITTCFAMVEGFIYKIDSDETPYPFSFMQLTPYKKQCSDEKNILYVQNTACIRTHKIAAVMKSLGYKVFLLYTIAPPEYNNVSFKNNYSQIYSASTADEIIDFINNSEFDIVHSSNAPDILTSILVETNKKIVFDTHDMMSMRGHYNINDLTLEYIANIKSDGLLHVTEGCYKLAKKKYNINDKPALIIENYPLYQYDITDRQNKLSSMDGELHCVYEGGIVGSNSHHHRYFEKIWEKIIEAGIHVHFYSQSDELYCRKLESKSPYYHYEGNMGSQELINEMTKYDCGLAIFNVNDSNRKILEESSANKLYEYINSELPVLVGDLKSYIDFVEKYHVGKFLDINNDIKTQIQEVCDIKIEENFLNTHNMTIDSMANEIEQFYQKVINRG